MDLLASPAPEPETEPALLLSQIMYALHLSISKSREGQLFRIQVSVFLSVILLVALFFLGRLRRFVRMGWVMRSVTRIIYIVIPIALMYVMGLMHNASTFHILYPVWACSLIYAYGGVTTMTACSSLSDNDDTLSYTWRTLPFLFWTIWLALMVSNNRQAFPYMLVVTVLLFLCAAARNTWETLEAFYLASKYKGLPGLVEPLVDYMRDEREMPNDLHSPVTGYRYLVWGNPSLPENSITTTEQIWESVGTEDRLQPELTERLKDICLSYAFFRLILRRFADCPLYESSKPRTRRFVREGLLSGFEREPLQVSERVFNVMEVEHSFLFDFFYTKSYVCSSYKWIHFMWTPLCYAALLLSFGTVGISYLVAFDANSREQRNFNIKFFGHSLEVGITRIITLVFSAMEIWKFIAVSFSNRKMVWLLCNLRTSLVTKNVIIHMWILKDYLCRKCVFLSRPWKRKLGQYCFLESYGRDPVLAGVFFSGLGKLMKLPRAGQDGEYSVQLSTEVKQAVIKSLLRHVQDEERPLSRGMATAGRHDFSTAIRTFCLLENDAHLVLVWSIATSFFKHHFQDYFQLPENPNDPHFLVAVQLSEYCSYLVCFAPELLNGRAYDTECVFNSAVSQARQVRGWETRQGYWNLIDKNLVDLDVNILGMGAKLASKLEDQFDNSPVRIWLVLAEFWAELLLYLAPSNNVAAHGEYLARGGEFITHVWALLTHCGIVHR